MSEISIFNEDMDLAPENKTLMVMNIYGLAGKYKLCRNGGFTKWIDEYGTVVANPQVFKFWYLPEPTFTATQVRAMIQEVWSEGYDIEDYLKSKGI